MKKPISPGVGGVSVQFFPSMLNKLCQTDPQQYKEIPLAVSWNQNIA